jgi:hypothetical protein
MAKITGMTAATTPLAGTEPIELVQGGANRQATAAQVAALSKQAVAVSDDGVEVLSAATRLNFTGDGVTVTETDGETAIVTIPGGGGSGAGTGAYDEVVGDGTTVTFDIAHNLDTTAIVVGAWDNGTAVSVGQLILNANTVRVTFSTAPATGEGLVVVLASGGGGSGWGNLLLPGNAPSGLVVQDEFDGSSLSAWTEQTVSGTAKWGLSGDALYCTYAGQSSGHAAALLFPIPGTPTAPLEIRAAVRMTGPQTTQTVGVAFTDGTGTTASSIWVRINNNTTDLAVYSGTLSNLQATTLRTVNVRLWGAPWHVIGLRWVSANTWAIRMSLTGGDDPDEWTTLGLADVAATMTPTHVGPVVSRFGAGSIEALAAFDYFRVAVP